MAQILEAPRRLKGKSEGVGLERGRHSSEKPPPCGDMGEAEEGVSRQRAVIRGGKEVKIF